MQGDAIFNRYSRQIFMDEIGVEGQRKIMAAKILVIGAGGLGCSVIQYLAGAGVGTIGVVDFDKVELHNLNRQVLHKEDTVGMAKVESVAQAIHELNSMVQLVPINFKLEAGNAEQLIRDYDIVIDGSDSFTTRYLVNDTCVALKKTLIYGSIFSFEGQLAVFNFEGSRHLRNIFPEPPHTGEMPTCDGKGVLGPLPGIVGAMMAMQSLKMITGLPVDVNQLTVIDALNWNFSKLWF